MGQHWTNRSLPEAFTHPGSVQRSIFDHHVTNFLKGLRQKLLGPRPSWAPHRKPAKRRRTEALEGLIGSGSTKGSITSYSPPRLLCNSWCERKIRD
ncbi:hypothetical protein QYF36_011443 [Acer negundo]|nr:hypothetical protein QYF36_011443 [Acer negundo]